jgi:hypothetical protein
VAIEFTRERHHIKDWVTLPIEQLGEFWGLTANSEASSLDSTPLFGPRPTHVSKEIGQRAQADHDGSNANLAKAIYRGLCKTFRKLRRLQDVSPGQRVF